MCRLRDRDQAVDHRSMSQLRFSALCLALAVSGCGPVEEDVCDAKCECEGCSDREFDDCVFHHDDDFERADRNGCPELYDDLIACEDDTGRCSGSEWETSCKAEHDRFKNCVK